MRVFIQRQLQHEIGTLFATLRSLGGAENGQIVGLTVSLVPTRDDDEEGEGLLILVGMTQQFVDSANVPNHALFDERRIGFKHAFLDGVVEEASL